jgi:alpha-L-fucosidase
MYKRQFYFIRFWKPTALRATLDLLCSRGKKLKSSLFLTHIFLFALMMIISSCKKQEPYQPSWDSLTQHKVPQWLMDAKFGIYAHWGIYSVPAYGNEWYAKHMYDKQSKVYQYHVDNFGDPSVFGYKEFIPMFKAENYNPKEWADLIKGS